jgi:Zn-dependent M28 family amino/carboxypeptidase
MRALQLRPAAIVLLMSGGAAAFYDQAAPELMRTVSLAPGDRSTSDAERALPMVLLGKARQGSPLLPPNWPADDAPQALTGRRLSAHIALRQEPFTAYNVVGIVRGTDPRLNKTYVAIGAHYDHSGVVPGMTPDSILNGADDDGSGTVTTLAIARSLAAYRPRRSVLVVLHTAEEKGLFGSGQYASHPTVPVDSIVAMVNMDMVGRRGGATAQWDTRTSGQLAENRLYIVGPAAAPNEQSRVLGAIADSVNAAQARPLEFDRTWDTPTHPERIYYRSDHFPYANKGIPVLFFTTGLHEDYHKPTDEPGKIDYEKMSRIATMIADLTRALGNRQARPR